MFVSRFKPGIDPVLIEPEFLGEFLRLLLVRSIERLKFLRFLYAVFPLFGKKLMFKPEIPRVMMFPEMMARWRNISVKTRIFWFLCVEL